MMIKLSEYDKVAFEDRPVKTDDERTQAPCHFEMFLASKHRRTSEKLSKC